MAQIIKVYEALESLDKTEGRGGSTSLGYYRSESVAKQVAKCKGPMGSDGQVIYRSAIECDNGWIFLLAYDKPIQVHSTAKEGLIESARKKLTDEEAAAIGLK